MICIGRWVGVWRTDRWVGVWRTDRGGERVWRTAGGQGCGKRGGPRTSQVICITGLYKRLIWVPPAASTHAPITV